MLNKRKIILKFILIGSVFLLQACQNGGMNDLNRFVETAFQDKKPDIEPLPEMQPFSPYAYSARDDEDPFDFGNIETSQDNSLAESNIRPDANRRKEDLENFPLDALKMVGTMTQENTSWVIVQTSEGTAHRATLGNYMGQREGKIVQIIPDEQKVVLAEIVQDPNGRWITRDVEIKIDE